MAPHVSTSATPEMIGLASQDSASQECASSCVSGWVVRFSSSSASASASSESPPGEVSYAHMATLATGPPVSVLKRLGYSSAHAGRGCAICGESLPALMETGSASGSSTSGSSWNYGHTHMGGDQEQSNLNNSNAPTLVDPPTLFAAFQASAEGAEGMPGQHIRFTRSLDGGRTFEKTRAVVFNALTPAWSPVLHYDNDKNTLLLFYTESCRVVSPGGDVKVKRSTDFGRTWSPPQLVYSHDADGSVPKVLANKLCVLHNRTADGNVRERWVLPFWREPAQQWKQQHDVKTDEAGSATSAEQYHPMLDAAHLRDSLASSAVMHGMPCDHGAAGAGVLISDDRGSTWTSHGFIVAPPEDNTWLIENACFELPKPRHIVAIERDDAPSFYSGCYVHQLFRSSAGVAYLSTSTDDGMTWQKAERVSSLPNPNSKLSACTLPRGDDDDALLSTALLAYNPSTTRRAPLHVSMSNDPADPESWQTVCAVEADPDGHFAYPTICVLEANVQKSYYEQQLNPSAIPATGRRTIPADAASFGVAYSVWKEGIKFQAFLLDRGFEKSLFTKPKPGRFVLKTRGDALTTGGIVRLEGDFLGYRE
ncbi:glycosyl hydrolase family 33 protein [Pseudoscourfieldia marina]